MNRRRSDKLRCYYTKFAGYFFLALIFFHVVRSFT